MAISVVEKILSRPLTGGATPETDLLFTLQGSDAEGDLLAALLAATSATYDGLVRKTWKVEQVGPSLWDGTVHYEAWSSVPRDVGTIKIDLDIQGGTEKIYQSISTVASYVPSDGRVAYDFKGAINVTRDSVEGCDIVTRTFKFTATKVFAPTSLPSLNNLYALTGLTNAATFSVTDTITGMTISLAANECLLEGAKIGGTRGDGNIEISYDFNGSLSATGLTIGTITGIDKSGWDYLWVRYDDSVDGTANAIVKTPVAVYVEKVYDRGDFTLLGL